MKTNAWYNSQIRGKEVYKRELQAVQALRRGWRPQQPVADTKAAPFC
jgi:hypothetical protein